MQSETGFPSSHQLKSYVASKSRLKLAARAVLSADAGLLVYAVYVAIFVERRIHRFLLFYHVAWAEDYLRTKWHLDPSSHLATTDMGQNWGRELCPWGAAGSTSNTMLPGSRPTIIPSGILIHLAVWPQQKWAENRGAVPPAPSPFRGS